MIENVTDSREFIEILEKSGYMNLLEMGKYEKDTKLLEFSRNFGGIGTQNLGYYKGEKLQTVISISNLYEDCMVAHSLASISRYELRSKIEIYNQLFEIGRIKGTRFFIAYYEKGHPWHEKIFGKFNMEMSGKKVSYFDYFELFQCNMQCRGLLDVKKYDNVFTCAQANLLTNRFGDIAVEKISEVGNRRIVDIFDAEGKFVVNAIMEKFESGMNILNFFNAIKLTRMSTNNHKLIEEVIIYCICEYLKNFGIIPSYIITDGLDTEDIELVGVENIFKYDNPITKFTLDVDGNLDFIQEKMISDLVNRRKMRVSKK